MAIIVCPECGEKISSTVERCIHCGCKLNVCPECNKISVGEVDNCPDCGYQYVKKQSVIQEGFDDIKSTMDSFYNMHPFMKMAGIMQFVFYILALVLLGFCIGGVISWSNSEAFILTYQDKLESAKTLLIFAGIVWVFAGVFVEFCEHFIGNEEYKFINSKNIDMLLFVKKEMDRDFSSMTIEQTTETSSGIKEWIVKCAKNDNAIYRSQTKNRSIVLTLLNILIVTFLCLFISHNGEIYMTTVFLLGKSYFEFSMLEYWWALIIVGVVIVLKIILTKNFEKNEEAQLLNWVKKNLPEHVEIYKNRIADWIGVMVDQQGKKDRTE